jgi:hypothetical protein
MTESPRKPTFVTRPDPPSDDSPSKAPALSKEEVRALLTVAATRRPDWKRAAKRASLGLIPTALLGLALDSVIGWGGTPVLLVILLVWSAWPLLRQHRDGWT